MTGNCSASQRVLANSLRVVSAKRGNPPLRRISCHGRNYSQPYFFKRNQSSDNRSHGFGAKFLLKKLSASDFSYERKSALSGRLKPIPWRLAEFCYNRGLWRPHARTCIIMQETIKGVLCPLIVYLKSRAHQLNLKDLTELNRNLL